jgi:hypothetical protein
MHRLFLPTPRQTNVLLTVGFLSFGYAFYVRYLVIEHTPVGLACEAGLDTWLCLTRKVAMGLFNHSVFGAVALGAAVLNLIRPSIVLSALALAAGALGIVLYNVGLSGLAIALLLLSLARPVVETV